jgi:hypothetical protein
MGADMKKLFLFLLFLMPLISEARLINKCGTYYAEGYYTEIESNLHSRQKKKVILLERGTNSEIKFFISNSDIQKLIPDTHIGVNFKLKINFDSSCFYACEGKIVEVIEPIDPFQEPKPFLNPRPSPINGTEVKCKPNSFEDVEREPTSEKANIKLKK